MASKYEWVAQRAKEFLANSSEPMLVVELADAQEATDARAYLTYRNRVNGYVAQRARKIYVCRSKDDAKALVPSYRVYPPGKMVPYDI